MDKVIVTAGDVAQQLRLLAEGLEKEPDAVVVRGTIDFNCKYEYKDGKEKFINLARLLPKPLKKGVQSYDSDAMELRHEVHGLIITTAIERKKVCRVIEPERVIPAVYECEPLLSADEEEQLIK